MRTYNQKLFTCQGAQSKYFGKIYQQQKTNKSIETQIIKKITIEK